MQTLSEQISLMEYVKKGLNPIVRDAVAAGANDAQLSKTVSDFLRDPRVAVRIGKAAPHESYAMRRAVPTIQAKLKALHSAPDRAGFAKVLKNHPGLASAKTAGRLQAATPEAVGELMATGFSTVIADADDVTPGDCRRCQCAERSRELAAWIADGGCPPEAMAAVARRCEALWDLSPGSVTVTGWFYGGLTTLRDGKEYHAPAAHLVADSNATGQEGTNPLFPLVTAWLDTRSMPLTSRHVQAFQTERGNYSKTPGLMAATTGVLSIVKVDGEPFAGRMPLIPENKKRRAYRPKQEGTQGELLPGPRRLNRVPTGDMILASLDQWDLSADDRTTLRHDIIRLGRATYSLTGRATIPEDVGAKWLTGQTHATAAAKQRWWDTLEAMRYMTVRVDPKTHRWLDLFDVRPQRDGSAWLGPASWWVESRKEDDGPRAWRLSGGLWRPAINGDAPARGTSSGFWGALARTVDGIEAGLAWGPTTGSGKGGRLADYLRPTHKGGAGPEVFIPWRNVLRLAGEAAPDGGLDSSGAMRQRYKRRIDALRKAGYVLPGRGEAEAGDTIEIVRIVDGRGGRREGGIVVRASARFIEAYRLAQNSKAFELLPANRLFLPTGKPKA